MLPTVRKAVLLTLALCQLASRGYAQDETEIETETDAAPLPPLYDGTGSVVECSLSKGPCQNFQKEVLASEVLWIVTFYRSSLPESQQAAAGYEEAASVLKVKRDDVVLAAVNLDTEGHFATLLNLMEGKDAFTKVFDQPMMNALALAAAPSYEGALTTDALLEYVVSLRGQPKFTPRAALRAALANKEQWLPIAVAVVGGLTLIVVMLVGKAKVGRAAHAKREAEIAQRRADYREEELAKMRTARLDKEERLGKQRAEQEALREEAARTKAAEQRRQEKAQRAAAAVRQAKQKAVHEKKKAEAAKAGNSGVKAKKSAGAPLKVKRGVTVNPAKKGGPVSRLTVYCMNNEKKETMNVSGSTTVKELKEAIATEISFGLPAVRLQRLVFSGKVLADGLTVDQCPMEDGATVILALKAADYGQSLFRDARLVRKSGEVAAVEVKPQMMLIYFSAHWCPPCRQFTPLLKRFYETMKAAGHDLEIVFCSKDKSEREMTSYFNNDHGDWLALEYANRDLVEELSSRYGKSGIPAAVVVKPDGTVIDDMARDTIMRAMQYGGTEAELERVWGGWTRAMR